MSWGAIKRNKTDKLFSEYVRLKAKGQCEYCLRYFDIKNMDCSHFYGRRNKSVRWDEMNAASLCRGCHRHLGENPAKHDEFFKKRLGDYAYNALKIKANTPAKPDEKLIQIYLKEKIKELKNEIIKD